MNSAMPTPTGATKVALLFSTASMKIAKTSSAVRNISMKTPRAMDVPPPSPVCTAMGPGKRPETTAEAAMAPSIWAMKMMRPRSQGRASIKQSPSVTCGKVSCPSSR